MKKLPSNGQTTFKLTIRAEDSGKLFAEQVLRIDVRQDSTLAPKFVDKKMTLQVLENLPPISRVAALQVCTFYIALSAARLGNPIRCYLDLELRFLHFLVSDRINCSIIYLSVVICIAGLNWN